MSATLFAITSAAAIGRALFSPALAWRPRRRLWLAALGLCLAAMIAPAQADFMLSVETAAGSPTASAHAGDTILLRTYLTATGGEAVGGLFYTVVMPGTGWELAARDYASQGWLHNDGTFDMSTPVPATAAFPVDITADLFDLTPATPDFLFSSALPYPTTMGSGLVETFALVLPDILADGVYEIGFGVVPGLEAEAFDADGMALPGLTTMGLSLTVTTAVPEPGACTLALGAAVGLMLRRRRRRAA